jgi:predicted nucleotidyltransferase
MLGSMSDSADLDLASRFAAALRARLGAKLKRVSLFGSRARRQHRFRSDYDLMVVVAHPEGAIRSIVHDQATRWELERNVSLSTKILGEAVQRLASTGENFWQNFRRDELLLWPTNSTNA